MTSNRPVPTITAEAGGTCSCCKRTHRKLTLVDGYWLGDKCAEYYRDFKFHDSYLKHPSFARAFKNLCEMTGRNY